MEARMAQFEFANRVPSGFRYPLTIREARECARNHARIGAIRYKGISPHDKVKESWKWLWLGQVTGRRVQGDWTFELDLFALRRKHLDPYLESAKRILVEDSTQWIRFLVGLPASYRDGTNYLYVSVRVDGETPVSSSTEDPKLGWPAA
jgi:hypothetical protein